MKPLPIPLEAIKRFAEKKFQVLITDLKMKELDGIEILKLVQEGFPGNPGNYHYRICHRGKGQRGPENRGL